MDWIQSAFLFCFVLGAAISVGSFLLGGGGDDGAGHGADVGDAGDVGAEHGHGTHGPLPYANLPTLSAGLAFFGGIGYALSGPLGAGSLIAVLGGAVGGVAGGAAVFGFLTKLLLRNQHVLDPADFRLEGTVARVSSTIREGGIGEIIYTHDGVRHSHGARSATGEAIDRDTEVVVVRFERGIAHVEPWRSFVEEEPDSSDESHDASVSRS